MKNIITAIVLLLSTTTIAQHEGEARLEIATSTVCDMCERTIEENLIYETGVKSVQVDLEHSKVVIIYKARKNTPESLRAALVKLGYAADGIPGDPVAFAKLPACCQKEGCGKLPEDGTH